MNRPHAAAAPDPGDRSSGCERGLDSTSRRRVRRPSGSKTANHSRPESENYPRPGDRAQADFHGGITWRWRRRSRGG